MPPTIEVRERSGVRIDYPRRAYTGWRHFVPSWRQWLALVMAGVLVMVAGVTALYLAVDVPAPNDLSQAQSSVVYYNDGKTELGRFEEVNRTIVPLSDVPLHVQQAVLSAEDRDFYQNSGISPTGILRAAWNNITGGDTQGASTITQQYARNAYLTQDRTWKRKLKETILAIKLNREVSKDDILENYLNTIYFGRGAYGIQAASQAYFRRDVQDLTVEQGAVLAAIIRAPSSYDPAEGKAAKQALDARVENYVIPGMVEQGWLTADEAANMHTPKVFPPRQKNDYAGQNGYLLEYVRQELRDLGYSETEIDTGGLRVTTTFSANAIADAETAVEDGFPPAPNDHVEAGLAAVEPGTGAIISMYGGWNYLHPGPNHNYTYQQNNATSAQQSGSTFKPFALAAALDDGVTLSDTFDGAEPFYVDGYSQGFYNFGTAVYPSSITLLYALEHSVNTAFVDLTSQIGPQKVLDTIESVGIPGSTPGLVASPSIPLGNANVSPLQMASAYATFAAGGKYSKPYSVAAISDASGKELYKANPTSRQVMDPDIANEVNYALTQVVQADGGTAYVARGLGRPAAAKTGTSENNVTAWFVGYTPQLSTAVMFFKPEKNGGQASLNGVAYMSTFTGGGYPGSIWTAFMKAALEGEPILQFPPAPSIFTVPPPTPTKTSSSPTATTSSPSPTPTTSSPSPTPTTSSPSPTPTTSSPSPTGTATGRGGSGGGG